LRFYTKQECEEWLLGIRKQKPDEALGLDRVRIGYPPNHYQVFFFARWIAKRATLSTPALLWITEWGVWPTSENWHLYYKLRQTCGDLRLLHEAPGHLFLNHETEDLASFLQLCMLNGWGGYVVSQSGQHMDSFFSHDEYIDFFSGQPIDLKEVHEELGRLSAPLKV
jgi:hypothetical protein